jgi:hypothetical protein
MSLKQVVITRFSYRGRGVFKHVSGPPFRSREDPLDPKRLAIRFMLFALTCLPSVLGQVEQDFAWILLVDSGLPALLLARLRSLVSGRPDTFIHPFDPQTDLLSLGWLQRYLPRGVKRVVTTNLDDDDSLPTRFTAVLQRRLRDLEAAERLPPIGIVGARQIVQWDLLASLEAPLGWKAPWHRGIRVASPGLSLHCRVPEFDFCVLGLRHALADVYLQFSRPPLKRNVAWFRGAVLQSAAKAGIDLSLWQDEAFFYDISRDLGPVLMTNHVSNDQSERLFEAKRERKAVTGPDDFPDLPIDWSRASSVVRALSPSRRTD